MNIKMTKEDFKLLLDMYNEAFEMIILKKYFNVGFSFRYSAEKYMELKEKLLRSAEEQKVELSEIEIDKNSFIELAGKITKNESEQMEILKLQLKELFSVEELQEELLSMVRDVCGITKEEEWNYIYGIKDENK